MERIMGVRALRLVAAGAALAAAFAVTTGPAIPAEASSGEVVIAVTTGSGLQVGKQANDSSWQIETVATGLYGQPSVAMESNGNIVIAAVFLTGSDRGTLYYFWQAPGSTVWHRQQVSAVAAVAPLVPPSIAAQHGSAGAAADTVIVAQNATGTGSTYYWQQIGTAPWHTEAIPTVNGTAAAPYVSVDSQNTSVVSFATPKGFGLDRQAYASATWETVQEVYPGGARQGVQAADENDGRIVVSATTPVSDQLNFYWNTTGKVSGWVGQNLPWQADDQSAMAVNAAEHNVTIAAYDPSFSSGECISTYTQDDGSTAWHRQADVTCPGWGGNADVAIAAQSSGGLVMTSIDSSGVVDFYAEAPGGSTWSVTRITGIPFPMDTPAIAAN
jgi:hypothetical protein